LDHGPWRGDNAVSFGTGVNAGARVLGNAPTGNPSDAYRQLQQAALQRQQQQAQANQQAQAQAFQQQQAQALAMQKTRQTLNSNPQMAQYPQLAQQAAAEVHQSDLSPTSDDFHDAVVNRFNQLLTLQNATRLPSQQKQGANTDLRQSLSKITLTPAHRAAAKALDMNETEYAKALIQMRNIDAKYGQ
jgi:hypothetical protein